MEYILLHLKMLDSGHTTTPRLMRRQQPMLTLVPVQVADSWNLDAHIDRIYIFVDGGSVIAPKMLNATYALSRKRRRHLCCTC